MTHPLFFVYTLALLSFTSMLPLFPTMDHFLISDARISHENQSLIWNKENAQPFNEMLISWSAKRPAVADDMLIISFRLKTGSLESSQWSSWIQYAFWGASIQASSSESDCSAHIKVDTDTITVIDKIDAYGYEVKIEALSGLNTVLESIDSIHVFTRRNEEDTFDAEAIGFETTLPINVPPISQLALQHHRKRDLCSPTSVTSVISYLVGNRVDPLSTASHVYDTNASIFGNWTLNTAHASSLIRSTYAAWVERLTSFQQLHTHLQNGYPVIVSIRGELKGAFMPYRSGHLVVIRGYDREKRQILCMDPAFTHDEMTYVSYDLNEFIQAWRRRGFIAYVFQNKSSIGALEPHHRLSTEIR